MRTCGSLLRCGGGGSLSVCLGVRHTGHSTKRCLPYIVYLHRQFGHLQSLDDSFGRAYSTVATRPSIHTPPVPASAIQLFAESLSAKVTNPCPLCTPSRYTITALVTVPYRRKALAIAASSVLYDKFFTNRWTALDELHVWSALLVVGLPRLPLPDDALVGVLSLPLTSGTRDGGKPHPDMLT